MNIFWLRDASDADVYRRRWEACGDWEDRIARRVFFWFRSTMGVTACQADIEEGYEQESRIVIYAFGITKKLKYKQMGAF